MKNPIEYKTKKFTGAARVAYVALFAATLTGGKFALSFLPNIEIVTVLILVYGSVFGVWYVLPATIVFCLTETLLYGFGTWVVSYFIYWNTLGVLAAVLLKKQKMWQALILAVCSTLFFGVLTTATDVTIMCLSQNTAKDFFNIFAAKYVLGVVFYALHLASAVATVTILYKPFCKLLNKIKLKTVFD